MSASFDILLTATIWAAVLRIATPLVFGMLGELLCERAGIVNLGIEGIMTVGALAAWLAAHAGCGLWTAWLIAALCGAVFGLLHGVFSITLAQSQHVTGLGITLLASGLASFVYSVSVTSNGSPPTIQPFAPLILPVLGAPFLSATAPTYLAFALTAVLAYLLWLTPLGLALRLAGENPQAAQAQGLSVAWLRYGALAAGSALMALGGAFLTTAAFNSFVINMVQGRGWMALALVVFGAWRPGLGLLGALLYALFDAYQLRLQALFPGIPYQVFLMAPYLLAIVAMIPMARRAIGPQALMRPFVKGER
ncbi:ABC transporter permease [Paraburkholderia sp. BCC1886]|uniref:ABC transporter permease n=1 Tax=Paraburkholderia sp. BCC1886 TaxID=2562670 RepID=UPI001181E83F|nr:ABC transporter permease [Paraburkholderia sp. BCC1886]